MFLQPVFKNRFSLLKPGRQAWVVEVKAAPGVDTIAAVSPANL